MDADVVIVGAGLTGAAAAWALAAPRPLGDRCSSSSRPDTTAAARTAARASCAARTATRSTRADRAGLRAVARGRARRRTNSCCGCTAASTSARGATSPAIAAHLADAGVPHEVLPAAEAEQRWPGMRVRGRGRVSTRRPARWTPRGAVDAMLGSPRPRGATSGSSTRGRRGAAAGRGRARRRDDARARRPWSSRRARGSRRCSADSSTLPPLRVTQQQIFHFPRLDAAAPPWPSVIHEDAGREIYHLAGGRDGGAGRRPQDRRARRRRDDHRRRPRRRRSIRRVTSAHRRLRAALAARPRPDAAQRGDAACTPRHRPRTSSSTASGRSWSARRARATARSSRR